jgi:predicted nucleic acid-binding protein
LRYLYDTGVLIAAERGERLLWMFHRRLLEDGAPPIVPSTVLAQAWRGGPQAELSRLLRGCEVRDFTERDARQTGRLLAMAGATDIVDAGVIVMAQQRGLVVLTSDPDDLARLASTLGRPKVNVQSLTSLTAG